MCKQSDIHNEIEKLKFLLQQTVQKYQYNFHHPQVIEISQKLDGLIIKIMKETTPHAKKALTGKKM